jgi:hypothetical protein
MTFAGKRYHVWVTRLRQARFPDVGPTTLGEVDKRFSETPRSEAEIVRHTDGLADMFCAYLDELARRGRHS